MTPSTMADPQDLLALAGITDPVRVVNCEEHANGTTQWSEVRTDRRPWTGQVAHCAHQEDAELIAHLINAALRARAAIREGESADA